MKRRVTKVEKNPKEVKKSWSVEKPVRKGFFKQARIFTLTTNLELDGTLLLNMQSQKIKQR